MLLAAVAAGTESIRVGTLVTPVGVRHPAVLARMAATLDQLADGRLDLGLGAGWFEREYREHGLEFPPARRRLVMLAETLEILTALFGGGTVSFAGVEYQLEAALLDLLPMQRPRPPLWVGGKRDRLLQVVAWFADGWNLAWSATPEQYEHRLGVLRAACGVAGRDFSSVRRSLGLVTLVGLDADDVIERWRRLQAWVPASGLDGVDLKRWAAGRLVGTPDEIVEQLRRWEGYGVEQVVCAFGIPFGLFEDEQLDLMAERVLPRLA